MPFRVVLDTSIFFFVLFCFFFTCLFCLFVIRSVLSVPFSSLFALEH